MNASPLLLISLLVAGAASGAAALWIEDHSASVPQAGVIVALLMVAFFICFGWAFFSTLHALDRRRARQPAAWSAARQSQLTAENVKGTVHGLVPGHTYRVAQPFTDCNGGHFQQGELLRFRERHFVPYHGGYTLIFEERTIYLHEDENAAILGNFGQYLVEQA